jgi:hypothetical protein
MVEIICGNEDCVNNLAGNCTEDDINLWPPREDESLLYCDSYEVEDENEED